MFVKLLKHEWQANRGLIGLLCVIIAISGLLTGGILRYMTWSSVTGNEFMVIIYTIILTAAVLAIFGCCVGVMYLLVYRFYQSRFTDQGYLMLTLPVTTHQQLLSSITNTVIGVVLVGITAIISAAVGMGIYLISFEQGTMREFYQMFAEIASTLVDNLKVPVSWMWVKVLEVAVSFLADIILFMLAVTVGSQARRHPVLKGAAVYIGIDILVSEGSALFGSLVEDQLLTAAVSCILYGITGLIAYFLMHHIIDKKLNLT